jgi:uncharacterized protein involved in exopolysaccharide biosynthesis
MDKKTEATINQLCHQRNQAHDTVAELCGEIAARDEEIASLKARVAELEAGPAAPGT